MQTIKFFRDVYFVRIINERYRNMILSAHVMYFI